MTATVPHVTSGSGLRKFQADGFLFDRVYIINNLLFNMHDMNIKDVLPFIALATLQPCNLATN